MLDIGNAKDWPVFWALLLAPTTLPYKARLKQADIHREWLETSDEDFILCTCTTTSFICHLPKF